MSSANTKVNDLDISALKFGETDLLSDRKTDDTYGFTGSKKSGAALLKARGAELVDLQKRLWASTRSDSAAPRNVLLVLQGMDTAGKGGTVSHVFNGTDLQAVTLKAFKSPTEEELAHDFLWRIKKALPGNGQIGIFDRSHYEDVLIVRVLNLVPESEWSARYEQINAFEAELAAQGTQIIKVMLHVGYEEQRERLRARLEDPNKHYKFNPGDLDQRERWKDYEHAYQVMLEKCSTEVAPWHVVPADRKWYTRLAVQQLLLNHLRAMDLDWPPAEFDVDQNHQRLMNS